MKQYGFLIALFICFYSSETCAANFYVDATLGGDYPGATGAIGDPWKKIKDIEDRGGDTSYVGGDSIFFKRGEIWRDPAYAPQQQGGDSGLVWFGTTEGFGDPEDPIYIGAYDSGHKPIISGFANPSYEGGRDWFKSTNANEYYLATTGDGDPGYHDAYRVFINTGDTSRIELERDPVGSLADSTWDYTDNSGELAFETIYMRLDADSAGGNLPLNIEISQMHQRATGLFFIQQVSNMTVEDFIFEGTNAGTTTTPGEVKFTQGLWAVTCTSFVARRIEARYICGGGIALKSSQNSRIDSCHVHHNIGDGFSWGAVPVQITLASVGGDSVEWFSKNDSLAEFYLCKNDTLSRCVANDQENTFWAGSDLDTIVNQGDGSGIKSFNIKDNVFENCLMYNNTTGGMRFDGGTFYGTEYSIIRDNVLHTNGWVSAVVGSSDGNGGGGVFMEVSYANLITRNRCWDNRSHQIMSDKQGVRLDQPDLVGGSYPDDVMALENIKGDTISYNIIPKTVNFGSGINVGNGFNTLIINNTVDSCYKGIVLDGDNVPGSRTSRTDWVKIYNNIVTNGKAFPLWYRDKVIRQTITSNNNLFEAGSSTGVTVRCNGGTAEEDETDNTMTLVQWQTTSGQDASSIENSDPKYVDNSIEDFRLQYDSPCKNTGIDLGYAWKDFGGATRISRINGSIDMGAHEFGARLPNVYGAKRDAFMRFLSARKRNFSR